MLELAVAFIVGVLAGASLIAHRHDRSYPTCPAFGAPTDPPPPETGDDETDGAA